MIEKLRAKYILRPLDFITEIRRRLPEVVLMCELGASRSEKAASCLREKGVDAMAVTGGVSELANMNVLNRPSFSPYFEATQQRIIKTLAKVPTTIIILHEDEWQKYIYVLTELRLEVERNKGNFMYAFDEEVAVQKYIFLQGESS